MRRGPVALAVVIAGLTGLAATARRQLNAHFAEGTLPGRSGSWINSYLNRPSYRLMAAAVGLEPEDDVLDIACGWGEFLAVHACEAHRVAGIDVSQEKVTLARERLAPRIAQGTADVVRGDAASLPWGDSTFSAVTCMDAFPFLAAPDRVFGEVFRVLRPGGRMVMQIGMKWPDGPPEHMLHPRNDLGGDQAAVRRLLEDAGFVDISISYGLVGGESRAANFASRKMSHSDELALFCAVKPT